MIFERRLSLELRRLSLTCMSHVSSSIVLPCLSGAERLSVCLQDQQGVWGSVFRFRSRVSEVVQLAFGFRRHVTDIAQRASGFGRSAPEVVQRSLRFRTCAENVTQPAWRFKRRATDDAKRSSRFRRHVTDVGQHASGFRKSPAQVAQRWSRFRGSVINVGRHASEFRRPPADVGQCSSEFRTFFFNEDEGSKRYGQAVIYSGYGGEALSQLLDGRWTAERLVFIKDHSWRDSSLQNEWLALLSALAEFYSSFEREVPKKMLDSIFSTMWRAGFLSLRYSFVHASR